LVKNLSLLYKPHKTLYKRLGSVQATTPLGHVFKTHGSAIPMPLNRFVSVMLVPLLE